MISEFGNRISSARKRLKMKQQDLADTLGVSQGTISRMEQGLTYPTADQMRELSAALKIDMGEMFDLMAGMADDVERAIAKSNLSLEDQDTVLRVYGLASGRNSLEKVILLRTKFPEMGGGPEPTGVS